MARERFHTDLFIQFLAIFMLYCMNSGFGLPVGHVWSRSVSQTELESESQRSPYRAKSGGNNMMQHVSANCRILPFEMENRKCLKDGLVFLEAACIPV